MGNDKEEADTWFEIGFEDEAWEAEKTNASFKAMRERMRKEKKEEADRKRNDLEFSEWRGYYSLVMAAHIVAGLHESTALRTGLPSYPVWVKATSARRQEWKMSGGLTRPKDDFSIAVRQVQRDEQSFVYLSDFIEWAIEAGCAVAPSAIKVAKKECDVSDTFKPRARLSEIERTQAELRSAKTESVEGILARDDRLKELARERKEIISLLSGDDPPPSGGASAPPLPAGESCIPCPPTNQDDWYLIIRDAARRFHAKHGRCPENKADMWAWLNSNPSSVYGITSGQDRGGEKALFSADGGSLGKRSFLYRWDRYTCGTKERNRT